jgi:hypothetical protein
MAATDSEAVLQIINYHIDLTCNPDLTISENLEAAQASAMNARKGSYDTDGRDAEYYLKARWLVSKSDNQLVKEYKGIGGVGLTHAYNLLKWLYICAGQEERLRTDPDEMVSPPGGANWASKGAEDAMHEDGSAIGKPRHANRLGMFINLGTPA